MLSPPFTLSPRPEISQLAKENGPALQSIAFCIRCGAKCGRCNQMNIDDIKGVGYFFLHVRNETKNQEAGFVPDRYLLKSDCVVAEEERNGAIFRLRGGYHRKGE